MTALDPHDQRARAKRDKDKELARQVAVANRLSGVAWLFKDPAGRQFFRHRLAEGGLDIRSTGVSPTFDRHHGQMSEKDERRTAALELLWPALQALVSEQLTLGDFQLLFTENTQT